MQTLDAIAENTAALVKYLSARSAVLGREIYLVGAVKTRTAAEISAAASAGLKIIGENSPQEFRDKFSSYPAGVEKHFIGHLQSNKIKYVVGKADLIQSGDSLALLAQISARAARLGVVQDVLAEVNISGEHAKHGFSPKELTDSVSKLKTLENVRFRGLMAVLPKERGAAEACMDAMRGLYGTLSVFFPDFKYLSVGMTDDYVMAIERGSNMIRLGRAIFGERNYPPSPQLTP